MTHGTSLTDENPGAAPLPVAAATLPADMVLATRTQRFWTLLIDWVTLVVCAAVVSDTLARLHVPNDDSVVLFATAFVYYLTFEATVGKTPGKASMRTRVVAESGARPSLARVAGRTVLRFIPLDPLSFFGREQYGWHDSLSRTRVISERR